MKAINYSAVNNWDDACLVDVPFGTSEDCEGNEIETFLAGWCNACTMIDDGELDPADDREVLRFVFSEFDNMGYKR